MDIQGTIMELRDQIQEWDYAYYTLNQPLVSDAVYDKTFNQLKELEKEYPEFSSSSSPTQRVGAEPAKNLKKVTRKVPMLSLDNVFDQKELVHWAKNLKLTSEYDFLFVVQPKLDGAAVEIEYQNGELFRASTRGDGTTGEDVTHNIRTIKSVPLAVPEGVNLQTFSVRGEVVITKEKFEQINLERERQGKPLYINPRNAAAGALRNLDPREASAKQLSFFAYDILTDDVDFEDELFKMYAGHFIHVPVVDLYPCQDIQKIIEHVEAIQRNRQGFSFDIDGAVIKVVPFAEQSKLGYTSRSPRWAIALKFEAEKANTTITNITVQVGRTGALTPVAELEPVLVGQATISRATLHNQDMIKSKNLNIGDVVSIQRAGDVIPEIIEVVEKKSIGYFQMPEQCPTCGGETIRADGEAVRRCVSASCPSKLLEGLKHFASRDAMNIEGLGDKIIEQLVEKKIVTSFYDLFLLLPLNFAGLDRVGDKTIWNIIQSIQRSKKTKPEKLLYALGIPMVGKVVAKKLVNKFGSIPAVADASMSELTRMDSIGSVIAKSIVMYFSDSLNRWQAERLNEMMEYEATPEQEESNKLEGKVFVVTGNHSRPREELKELIGKHGGRCVGSISKKVNVLLAGAEAGPKKITKAKELDLAIWSESDLENFLQR